MRYRTVPLFNQSTAFVGRLKGAAADFGETRYHYSRRVNWSHRYCDDFYGSELDLFQNSPDEYFREISLPPPILEDVMKKKLSNLQVLSIIFKVFAHWMFFLIGLLANSNIINSRTSIYRKGWVDDIENTFDAEASSVVRAIYPFPINFRRQLRYLMFLRKKKYLFKLDGNPYIPSDVFHFLLRRNVKALSRMEARANIKHGFMIKKLGVSSVELSDEFDLGSLDFCRILNKLKLSVTNAAHGVGKYLPVHGYQKFFVLTQRQADYYTSVKSCDYILRKLNDENRRVSRSEDRQYHLTQRSQSDSALPNVYFVFLSQVFQGSGKVIADNESSLLRNLSSHFGEETNIKLFYKKHPNSNKTLAPDEFEWLYSEAQLDDFKNVIFGSFYSTCQIDPSFRGEKVLLRSNLLYPEIVFDSSEKILSLDDLVIMLEMRLDRSL